MRSKIASIAGTTVVLLGTLLLGTAASASATTPAVGGLGSCNGACLWNGTGYGGSNEDILFQSDSSLPSGISNDEKSAANELSGKYARFYYGSNYTGAATSNRCGHVASASPTS